MAVGVGVLVAPASADAGIFSAIRAVARLAKGAAKVAKGAGKVAKGAGAVGKGAAVVGGVSAGAKVARSVGAVSKLATAERAAVLFASVPDEAGRGVALLARDGDVWHLARRGVGSVESADDAGRLVGSLDDAGRQVDVFLDPSAGLTDAARLPAGARLSDATGRPTGWRVGPGADGRMRAWPEVDAGTVAEAALDIADVADVVSLGWDLAQVSLELGVNEAGGATDPRGLKLVRIGDPCAEASPVPWQVSTKADLTAELAAQEPSRVLIFHDDADLDVDRWLDTWTDAGAHTLVTIRVPDICHAPLLSILIDTARRDAVEGDRLPLVMMAPLDGSSVRSEDPLRFCGDARLAAGVPVSMCWSVPSEVPEPLVATEPEWEDDPEEPPLWLYGVAVLISIPVIVVMKRRGMLDGT